MSRRRGGRGEGAGEEEEEEEEEQEEGRSVERRKRMERKGLKDEDKARPAAPNRKRCDLGQL